MVQVLWTDAAHIAPGAWTTEPVADTVVMVTSVGMVVSQTRTHLVIAQSSCDSGDLTGVFSIPRPNIVALAELEVKRSDTSEKKSEKTA
jgi:hypothetical protein